VENRTAAEMGRMLGASHMVVGSYDVTMFPERRTANIRLVQVETAAVIWGGHFEAGTTADLEAQALRGLTGSVVTVMGGGDNRAQSARDAKRYEQALADYERALRGFRQFVEAASNDAPGWANRAQVCAELVRCSCARRSAGDGPLNEAERAWQAEGEDAVARA